MRGILFFPIALACLPVRGQDSDVVYKPLKFGGVQEFGTVFQGVPAYGAKLASRNPKLDNEWVDHFGTYLQQDVSVDGNLELQLGLGGVFQYPKPEYVFPKFKSSMYKLFFVGPSIAKATYLLMGDAESPVFTLGGGLFPFKYNSDAANLGEYLYRSGPYPAYIMTGGLTYVNDNSAYLQGLHAALRLGNLSLDLLFTTETTMPPLYDWSLGAIANYSIADGVLELGAGVKMNRLVVINADRTQPKTIANSTFIKNGKRYYGSAQYYQHQATFYSNQADTLLAQGNPTNVLVRQKADAFKADADSMNAWLNSPAADSLIPEGIREYYTPAGLLLMGRMSLDLKKLTGMEGKEPFKIFAEAAILGWKNYPIFYEDRWQRAPIMVGAHIPTFGILNQFTVQFEYFNSPWSNSTYNLGSKNLAIPAFPDPDPMFSKEEYNDVTKHDNFAWSVLMRREIYSHLNLSAQFARDHLRTVGTSWFYGGRLEPSEILYRNSSWYWMLQLGWSI
jgi:hypothetical protein